MTALLEDDAYFDAFFNTMPQALPMHQAVEQRIRSNLAIARASPSRSGVLRILSADLPASLVIIRKE